MKSGLVLVLAALLFVACKKDTFVEYRIDNQSSGPVNVSGWNYQSGLIINTSIFSGDRSQVAVWSTPSLVTAPYEPEYTLGSDLLITNANGATCTKDYLILSNWTADIQEEKHSADHIYTLVITDDDF